MPVPAIGVGAFAVTWALSKLAAAGKVAGGIAMSGWGKAAGAVGAYSVGTSLMSGGYSAGGMSGALGQGTFIGDEASLTGGASFGESTLGLLGWQSERQREQQAGQLRGYAHDLTNEWSRGGFAGIGGYSGDFDLGGRQSFLSDRAKARAAEREADRLAGRGGQG